MDAQLTNPSPNLILQRIDTIIFELQTLRQAVLEIQTDVPPNLTAQLYGALGQGSWEEYQQDLDWLRFDS